MLKKFTFTTRFLAAMRQIRIGDLMNRATELGPLARQDLLLELDEQVQRSAALGAAILCGGKQLKREGYFYAPTVLANLKQGMPAY